MAMARLNPGASDTGAAGQPTFVARGLTKTYRTDAGEVHALRGIDLELWPGELVVMLGPSGSGKSTFLNILGGLDIPTAGQVLYRGADLAAFNERARTRYRCEQIGFVFQFYNLIPSLTALENVMLATEVVANPLHPQEALDLAHPAAAPAPRAPAHHRTNEAAAAALPASSPAQAAAREALAQCSRAAPAEPHVAAHLPWCSHP